MKRHDSHSLGIELDEREIRLVLANVRGSKPTVARAMAFPLPTGAVMNGVVLEPGTLSLALRRAIDAIGSSVATAAVGVSSDQSNFRTVTVPPCPEAELPTLVSSEIDHQGALNPGDPYGFFPIHPNGGEPEVMQTLAVVGTDAGVTHSLVEALEGAGLGVSALEPIPLAMLRTAATGLLPGAASFILVVGRTSTEAAYLVGGELAAFRRLDVGSAHLVNLYASYEDEYGAVHEGLRGVDHDMADRLAVEAQRTMDYVQRADRAAAIDHVRIVCDDAAVDPLAGMLERRFGMPIEIVRAPAAEGEMPDARFTAAYGLAIRSVNGSINTPTIDLFTAGRIEARRVETRRYFVGSLFVACLSIAIGLIGCVLYSRQIDATGRRVAGIKAQIDTTKKATDEAIDRQATEAMRDKSLRKEGIPMGAIIDDVSSGVDSGVGLRLVSVADDLTVRLEGEAKDETALVRTAEALKGSPVILNVAVNRFDRILKGADSKAVGGIKFEISGATVAADRVARKKA